MWGVVESTAGLVPMALPVFELRLSQLHQDRAGTCDVEATVRVHPKEWGSSMRGSLAAKALLAADGDNRKRVLPSSIYEPCRSTVHGRSPGSSLADCSRSMR